MLKVVVLRIIDRNSVSPASQNILVLLFLSSSARICLVHRQKDLQGLRAQKMAVF